MCSEVTFDTKRNNVKPMCFIIAVVMVVSSCLLAAIALASRNPWEIPGSDSFVDCIMRFILIRISSSIFFPLAVGVGFAFFCFRVAIIEFLAPWSIFVPMIPCPLFDFVFLCSLISFPSFAEILLSSLRTCVPSDGLIVAFFAVVIVSILCRFVLVEFRQGFRLLASAALFGYDGLRHVRFSLNSERMCLEPVTARTAIGSLYCSEASRIVNPEYRILEAV